MLRTGSNAAEAASLAAIAVAAIPNAPEAIDALVRALVAERRFADAISHANANPDPVLASVELAEIELARNAGGEARRALARADARIQSSFALPRALAERVARLQRSVAELQIEASAGIEGSRQ
jgi:hypothetical protein